MRTRRPPSPTVTYHVHMFCLLLVARKAEKRKRQQEGMWHEEETPDVVVLEEEATGDTHEPAHKKKKGVVDFHVRLK